jgi:hypothetical protein
LGPAGRHALPPLIEEVCLREYGRAGAIIDLFARTRRPNRSLPRGERPRAWRASAPPARHVVQGAIGGGLRGPQERAPADDGASRGAPVVRRAVVDTNLLSLRPSRSQGRQAHPLRASFEAYLAEHGGLHLSVLVL